MSRLHWTKLDQHCRLFDLAPAALQKKMRAGKPNRVRFWLVFAIGIAIGILIANPAVNAQDHQATSAGRMPERLLLGLDIWSIPRWVDEGAAPQPPQPRAPQLPQQASHLKVEQAAPADDGQELVDQLAELRNSLGSGISPILAGVGGVGASQPLQDLEIIFIDEIKRLAKQEGQQQREQIQEERARQQLEKTRWIGQPAGHMPGIQLPLPSQAHLVQPPQPVVQAGENWRIAPPTPQQSQRLQQAQQQLLQLQLQHQQLPQQLHYPMHQQTPHAPQPVAAERMLQPIEANLRDEPPRSAQHSETRAILRKSARLLEQAAAELEVASRFRDADQLRQQASRLWKDAR